MWYFALPVPCDDRRRGVVFWSTSTDVLKDIVNNRDVEDVEGSRVDVSQDHRCTSPRLRDVQVVSDVD